MGNEITGHWKRKLAELDEKIKNSEAELEKNQNLKLKSAFEGTELSERISYLKDWIDFHLKEKSGYEAKLKGAEEAGTAKEEAAFKLVFGEVEEEKPKADVPKAKAEEKPVKEAGIRTGEIKSGIRGYRQFLKYALPFAILLLIIASLFFIKPEITGHVVLSKETSHNGSLSLKMNESGNYTWDLGKPANIKSIKATGSVIGNGSVKIYIEKDGKRYLIYKNKQ